MRKRILQRTAALLLVLTMLLGFLPVTAAAETTAQTAELYDLRVNDLDAPVGIDDPTPSFSWKMRSDAIGAAQTAYAITVSEGETEIWNTGWVESDASIAIPYVGETALRSSTAYTVTVQIKDQNGQETAPVQTTFEMGLLEEDAFADTQWISYSDGSKSVTDYSLEFDLMIHATAAAPCFGIVDNNNMVMWQLQRYTTNNTIRLRPHVKAGGSWTAKNFDITEAMGSLGVTMDNILGKQLHMRIEASGATFQTYIGNTAEDMILVNTYTRSAAVPLNGIGFRGSYTESSSYDNLVVRDGDGTILYSYDFDDSDNLGFTSSHVSASGGMLKLGPCPGVAEAIISADQDEAETASGLPAYRKAFSPKGDLVSAKLYTSGLGVYESYINGARVGRRMDDGSVRYDELKPGFTEAHIRKFYNSYDVTWMVEAGEENVLSGVVASGWWTGDVSNRYVNPIRQETGYFAKLILTYADGTQEVIHTDTTWKSAKASALQMADIFDGETYDARVDQSWMLPGFDDSGWNHVKINKEFSGVISAWSGVPIAIREDLTLNPQEIYVYDSITGADDDHYGTIAVDRTYGAGETMTLNPGETMVVDFGQNHVGWEEIRIEAAAGTSIVLDHGEWINDANGKISRGNDGPEGSIHQATYGKAATLVTYIAAGTGIETYHPSFTYYGYRYTQITADQPVTIHGLRSLVVNSVETDTGWIETSDEDVNQLISNTRWSMYSNYFSVPTDCPQRAERQGWTADTQVFSETGNFLSRSKSFLEKWMQDMRDCQKPTGAFADVAPASYLSQYAGGIGWADAGIIVPYNLYMMYGDKSTLTDNWEAMERYMDYLATTEKKGGTTTWGDWLSPASNDATIKAILGVSFFAWDARMMAEMAEILGETEAAAKYTAVYEEEKAYFIEQFVNEDGTLSRGDQVACLYALYLDLLPDASSVEKVTEQLVDNIEANGNKLQTGFLGTAIINDTLSKIGRSDVAYKLLLQEEYPSWLYPVKQGATTIWERWDGYTIASGMTTTNLKSLNHYAYGSVVGWMFKDMAGIGYDAEQPGFKHILLSPEPNQMLSHVDAAYDSAYGTIESSWKYEDGVLAYDAVVPANTTATIRLPVEQTKTLTVNGKPADGVSLAADGIVFTGYEDHAAVFEAVAGAFAFRADVTVCKYIRLESADVDSGNVLPPLVSINGGELQGLPAILELQPGDTLTVSASLFNNVDYAIDCWTDGEGNVLAEGSELTYAVTDNDTITLSTKYIGKENIAEGAAVTSNHAVSTAEWDASYLTDGKRLSNTLPRGFTSNRNNTATVDVWIDLDLGESKALNRVQLYPRTDGFASDGGTMSFPKNFELQVRKDGETAYTTVASFTDYEAPFKKPAVLEFDTVNARNVRLVVTKVNKVVPGSYFYVQLAEIGVYNVADERATVTIQDAALTDATPARITVNGETHTLPAALKVQKGDTITVSAALVNDIDYAVGSWTDSSGSVLSEDAALTYTVNGDETITLNRKYVGLEDLALGAAVSSNAFATNSEWNPAFLTDGIYLSDVIPRGFTSSRSSTAAMDVWVELDLGADTMLNRAQLYPRTDLLAADGSTVSFPQNYEIQVRRDGETEYTTVAAVSNGTAPFKKPAVVAFDTVSARYVRVYVTKVNKAVPGSYYYVQLAELGLYCDSSKAAADVDALIEAIDVADKTTIDAARAAYAALSEEGKALVTKLAALEAAERHWETINGEVSLVLTGPDAVQAFGEKAVYTLSAKDMRDLATVAVTIAISEEYLSEPVAVAAEGWMILAQTWKDGVLGVAVANTAGASGDGNLLTITAQPREAAGTASVAVTYAELAAYLGEAETFVKVNLDKAAVTTVVEYSPFDVNKDGVIDLRDITRAQRSYGSTDATADVNHDGSVNVDDLILILNNSIHMLP